MRSGVPIAHPTSPPYSPPGKRKRSPRPESKNIAEQGLTFTFRLPQVGSKLLLLSNRPLPGQPEPSLVESEIAPVKSMEIVRQQPNVLTLDFVDVVAAGAGLTNAYAYQAGQFIWKQHGLAGNPWGNAVQFKNEMIARVFPPESGFEAAYKFVIDGPVPADLSLVIERADLYEITLNGRAVPSSKKWWLDRAFGRLDISNLARSGENRVQLRARPMTVFHELEPAYVIGDFSLRPAAQGFVIIPTQPLKLGGQSTELLHSVRPEQTAWLTQGIGFSGDTPNDDRAPELLFEFDKISELSSISVWQYNENSVRNNTGRGCVECVSGLDGTVQ